MVSRFTSPYKSHRSKVCHQRHDDPDETEEEPELNHGVGPDLVGQFQHHLHGVDKAVLVLDGPTHTLERSVKDSVHIL